mgnify:CR=1 FL=1|tara:strand:- start:6344 stop:6700 length:357 start_codon:yes stop_codon:yes gene_type:complete
MNWTKSVSLAFILVMLASCGNNEGTAEKAGKAMDDTVENIQDAIEDMDGDGPLEDAGETIDESLSDAKESTSETLANAKKATQEALDDAKTTAGKVGDDLSAKAKEAKRKAEEALKKN